MQTTHRHLTADARDLSAIADGSVQLVVTSPPYPMVTMWDGVFSQLSPGAGAALAAEDGPLAFERMHAELDRVWAECLRVLSPGGFAAVNIGDATRTIGGQFRLYHNHARIVTGMAALGFSVLPDILWRKPTNAPNKFMGSGMLPAGAYVTYEHEYILIFRKGGKRVFRSAEDRLRRSRSAFFWEERNVWFSDLWTDLRGTRQALGDAAARDRSAAFPFALPRRLVLMYSAQGDTVLDPFVGTGTTMAAAAATGRSSVGVDIAPDLSPLIAAALRHAVAQSPGLARRRIEDHERFVEARLAAGKAIKHTNEPHGFPVMTRQEQQLEILAAEHLTPAGDGLFTVTHTRLKPPAKQLSLL